MIVCECHNNNNLNFYSFIETKNANRDKELIKIIGVVLAAKNNCNRPIRLPGGGLPYEKDGDARRLA